MHGIEKKRNTIIAKNSLDIIQAAEDQGVKKMVECLVEQGFKKEEIQALCSKKSKGRKPEAVENPLTYAGTA